jgi:hypothetical protein
MFDPYGFDFVWSDDKRLQSTLKRLGVNSIPGIEEVNLFKEDGGIIHFKNPQVQASIGANTYVISGNAENKKLQDLLPGQNSWRFTRLFILYVTASVDHVSGICHENDGMPTQKPFCIFSRQISLNSTHRPVIYPGIINQLGPDNLENLKKLAGEMGGAAGGVGGADDDDVPDLVRALTLTYMIRDIWNTSLYWHARNVLVCWCWVVCSVRDAVCAHLHGRNSLVHICSTCKIMRFPMQCSGESDLLTFFAAISGGGLRAGL